MSKQPLPDALHKLLWEDLPLPLDQLLCYAAGRDNISNVWATRLAEFTKEDQHFGFTKLTVGDGELPLMEVEPGESGFLYIDGEGKDVSIKQVTSSSKCFIPFSELSAETKKETYPDGFPYLWFRERNVHLIKPGINEMFSDILNREFILGRALKDTAKALDIEKYKLYVLIRQPWHLMLSEIATKRVASWSVWANYGFALIY